MTEVETAAVATGVKAVQVLIDSHDHPDAQKLLTTAELSLSIQGKVEGIQDQIASTAQKIMAANPTVAENATGTLAVFNSTSTVVGMDEMDASPTSALRQIKNAQASLDQAKALLQQNKLDEVKDKLGDAAKAVSVAETVADVAINANVAASSSTPFLPAPDSASTSSSSVSVNSSTTPILPAPSTTTTATSSKSIKPDN